MQLGAVDIKYAGGAAGLHSTCSQHHSQAMPAATCCTVAMHAAHICRVLSCTVMGYELCKVTGNTGSAFL